MDKNNFSITNPNIGVVNGFSIEYLDDIREVFDDLPSLGIFNPYVLLDLLVERKMNHLKEFLNKKGNILIFNYNKEKLNYNFKMNGHKIYNLKKHLKDGSYHDIFMVEKNENIVNMVLRKQKDSTRIDFFDSCSDFFIHGFLSKYYKKILDTDMVIPRIDYLGINTKGNKFMGIMNLYKGTVFDILVNKDIKNKVKKNIIFKCLEQIAFNLITLQERFEFNHNDMKVNNIFYLLNNNDEDLKDVKFYLGDFGFSRIKVIHPKTKEIVNLIGGALLNYSKDEKLYSFIPSKDLYFLMYNIYVYSNSELKKSLDFLFYDLGNFDQELTTKDKWLQIYDDKIVRENYKPNNFLNILHSNKYAKKYLSEP